jgi:predicted enzyme related to lactoylglutathione lyase
VFGWSFEKWDGPDEYWLVKTGNDEIPGINGGLMRAQDDFPRTINTVQVDSVDAFAERVEANGGTVAVPKTTIPGVGHFAYCKDPEGVMFGITESDEVAE